MPITDDGVVGPDYDQHWDAYEQAGHDLVPIPEHPTAVQCRACGAQRPEHLAQPCPDGGSPSISARTCVFCDQLARGVTGKACRIHPPTMTGMLFRAAQGWEQRAKDAEAERDRLAEKLARWESGQRRLSVPVIEAVPDGLRYAAELAREALGVEEPLDQLMREAGMRLKALHDVAGQLLAEAVVNRAERDRLAEKLATTERQLVDWMESHRRAQATRDEEMRKLREAIAKGGTMIDQLRKSRDALFLRAQDNHAEAQRAARALARIHELVDAAEGTEQAPGPGVVDVEALRPCLDGTYGLVGGAE
jgi:chromosome segregation ATPase